MVARSSGANSMGHIPPPPPRPRTNPRKELEKDLQKNNPAVKDAWEKYQLVLKLAMPSGAIVSKPKPPKAPTPPKHRNIYDKSTSFKDDCKAAFNYVFNRKNNDKR